jgi:hypothetical protein
LVMSYCVNQCKWPLLTCSPKIKPLQTGLLTSNSVYSAEERTVRNEKE